VTDRPVTSNTEPETVTAQTVHARPRTLPSRSEPTPYHRLIWLLVALQAVMVACTVPFYSAFGLHFLWSGMTTRVAFVGLLTAGAFFTRGDKDGVSHIFVGFLLIVGCTALMGPAQYLAVALKRPLVDPWLAAADASMGVSVPAITDWTSHHPWLLRCLVLAYQSLLPQFALPIIVYGAIRPRLDTLWEYVFHFHVCAILTVIGLALWPAACVFSYYGVPSLLDQTRFTAHFEGLRAGTFHVLNLEDLEGLISFPSFHVAGALMVTWACRREPYLLAGVGLLNLLLIASTVMTGAHYALDIVATLAMFGLSVALYAGFRRVSGLRPSA